MLPVAPTLRFGKLDRPVKYRFFHRSNILAIRDVLNDAGNEGWELVVITPNNIAYLKRPMKKPRAKSSRQSSPPTKCFVAEVNG